MQGYGDWDFELRRDRIDSFTRDDFDAYCLSSYKNSVIRRYLGERPSRLGTFQTWDAVTPYIRVYGRHSKKMTKHTDILQRYLDLEASSDWRVISDNGNAVEVTCQSATHYYYMRFATS